MKVCVYIAILVQYVKYRPDKDKKITFRKISAENLEDIYQQSYKAYIKIRSGKWPWLEFPKT